MSHLRRWGAVYVLAVLFIGSWAGQFVAQLVEFTGDQQTHGEAFRWSDFWPVFLSATFENWQSEWFQLVFQAILLMGAKHLLFQVDAQDMERVERKIDAIQAAVGAGSSVPHERDEPGDPAAIEEESDQHERD